MNTKEAIILAGGMGKRLRQVVSDRPKPMAEINGRPFLEYLLDYLNQQGVSRSILSVGYMSESIKNHFHHAYKGMEISYSTEEVPLGTGGGILKALESVKSDSVLVINGDTYFPVCTENLEEVFYSRKADLVMALHPSPEQSRYGTIIMSDDGRILKFKEKNAGHEPALINGGIYLLKKDLFSEMSMPGIFSFEKDFLEKYTDTVSLFGLAFDEPFIDIGIPESYRQAQQLFH